jgi:hypothetical protein
MICFDCKKEIETEQDKIMLGLDIPYVNLWFHRNCYKLNVEADMNVYLGKNMLLVYNYRENEDKKGKNRRLYG